MKYTLALLAAVQAAKFPDFDSLHANCAMHTLVSSTCDQAYSTFQNTLTNFADPAGGLYAFVEKDPNMIWVTRTTPVKKYVDDIEFTFTNKGAQCQIDAKSRSQTLSYYDYDTNYCNMYNVIRSQPLQFTKVSTTDCKWVPADADVLATCNKY